MNKEIVISKVRICEECIQKYELEWYRVRAMLALRLYEK